MVDEKTGESVSIDEKRKRDKERLPEKPFHQYFPTSSESLPSKVSADEVFEIMKSCELGFVKGVLFSDHEYLIFGDIESEELEPFSGTPFQSSVIEENVMHLNHAKKFHELSFAQERDERVIGYQTSERIAWGKLVKKIKLDEF